MKEKIQIISNIVIVIALAAVTYHFNEKYSKLNEENEQHELKNRALLSKYSDSKQRIESLEGTITDLQNGVVEVDRLKIKSIRVEDFALVSKSGKELITMKSYPNRTFMMLKGEDGPNSIYFNVHDDGKKSISFRDHEAKAQIGIKTDEEGQPAVTVWRGGEYILKGSQGNHEIVRITETEHKPEISFYEDVCKGSKLWTTHDWWPNQSGDGQ